MTQTIKVPTADGEDEIKVLTVAEIDALIADNSPPMRKQLMDHMKALGRPVTELLRMKGPERKKYILERYEELGASPGKAKAGAKGATVTQIGTKKAGTTVATKAAGTPKTIVKGSKAATQAGPGDEEETEEPEGGDDDSTAEIEQLLGSQRLDIAELKELVDAQGDKIDLLTNTVGELMKLLLDTHFILRATAPITTGLSEDDIIEAGSSAGCYGTLLVSEVGEEVAAGNG